MKIRNRIRFIREVASSKASLFEYSLIPALVNCLTAEEVFKMLSVGDEQEANVRRALLNKMEKDILESIGTSCYLKLGPILIKRYGLVLSKKRGAIRTCLDRMLNVFPLGEVEEILIFFLTNQHVGTRRKAYEYLKTNWLDSYKDMVVETWIKYSDPEANTLLAAHFDAKELKKYKKRILEIVETSKYKIPVYKNLDSIDMALVSHLDKNYKITATSLRAINNIEITQSSALRLIKSELSDERYGLLLWSLGKLGHWSALVQAYEMLGKRNGL
jgi:hypothetical protein